VGYNQSDVQQPLYLAQSSNNYGLRLSFKFLNGFFIHIVHKLIDQRQSNLHILDFWVGGLYLPTRHGNRQYTLWLLCGGFYLFNSFLMNSSSCFVLGNSSTYLLTNKSRSESATAYSTSSLSFSVTSNMDTGGLSSGSMMFFL